MGKVIYYGHLVSILQICTNFQNLALSLPRLLIFSSYGLRGTSRSCRRNDREVISSLGASTNLKTYSAAGMVIMVILVLRKVRGVPAEFSLRRPYVGSQMSRRLHQGRNGRPSVGRRHRRIRCRPPALPVQFEWNRPAKSAQIFFMKCVLNFLFARSADRIEN